MTKIRNLHASPEAVEHAFFDALEHADIAAFMDLWSDDDEIACVPPGGPRLVGHDKIRQVWRGILANGPIHVRTMQASVLQGAMVSAHSMTVQLIFDRQGHSSVVHMDVSNIYFKGPLGWRLVLHHSSRMTEANATRETAPAANSSSNVLH
jgi:ketosteroid isomerase-like protein